MSKYIDISDDFQRIVDSKGNWFKYRWGWDDVYGSPIYALYYYVDGYCVRYADGGFDYFKYYESKGPLFGYYWGPCKREEIVRHFNMKKTKLGRKLLNIKN